MNFQNLNFDHVETPCSWPPRVPHPQVYESDSQSTIQPHNAADQVAETPPPESLSPQPTVIPRSRLPSNLSQSSSSPDLYGPDRFGQADPTADFAPGPAPTPPAVHFDEAQLAMFAAVNANRMAGLKDELTIAAGKVTPGVDDGPYIHYALAALTRDRGDDGNPQYPYHRPAAESTGCLPVCQPHGREMTTPVQMPTEPAPVHNNAWVMPLSPLPRQEPQHLGSQNQATNHPALDSPIWKMEAPDSERWMPLPDHQLESIDRRGTRYPALTYKPRILRPFSMMILMTLCLLMITALVFTAIYSQRHGGLLVYPETRYSGQYFLFRILPSLLAAIIVIYSQSIVAASTRILPFVAMADEDPRERYLALFRKLYPSSFLWPQWSGPWRFKAFSTAAWLALFTIPLQSAAFTCIQVDGRWHWAAVQGAMWTLVALYTILVATTGLLMVFWFGQRTGLIWDVRSIGDLIPLLSASNSMGSYEGLDSLNLGYDFKTQLRDRWFDRLGYWSNDGRHITDAWYAIGTSAAQAEKSPKEVYDIVGKRLSDDRTLDSRDLVAPINPGRAHYRYLPWCFRDAAVGVSVAVTGSLLLGLLIVSFLPQTRLELGFFPQVKVKPNSAAFSPANFLYSFLPSLLGMVLFLLFQSLDQTLRVLQPWGELSRVGGSPARKSILADYAACLPLQSTWRALNNRHWRVAISSLMNVLFVLIPVLAGGLFMALTNSRGEVRMFPSMPVFAVLLAFLVLYVGCLSLMMPHRRQFGLPHPVTCLAEVISLCTSAELLQDAAFQAVRSRQDLKSRLGLERRDTRDESVWMFGTAPGRDENRLSLRRLTRFTQRRARVTRSMV